MRDHVWLVIYAAGAFAMFVFQAMGVLTLLSGMAISVTGGDEERGQHSAQLSLAWGSIIGVIGSAVMWPAHAVFLICQRQLLSGASHVDIRQQEPEPEPCDCPHDRGCPHWEDPKDAP
jgi:hypothetical protein